MLLHHGKRNYEEAASDAASRARAKLEARIQVGRASGQAIIEKVMTEVPSDRLIKCSAIKFEDHNTWGNTGLALRNPDGPLHDMHKHALSQACGRVSLPTKYAGDLQRLGERGTELLAHSLNELYQIESSKRSASSYLVRSYDETVRGFLSNRYRRMDSRPLLEAFAGACQEVGALPIEGYGSDTKVALKAVLPRVFEPVEHECLSIGIMWENSDYGNGKHSISAFVDRLWCTNYAIMTTGFANVHLGKRLTDEMVYSQRTYQLDTETIASAIRDVVDTTMSPESVHSICEAIRVANSQEIDAEKALKALSKRLSKGEAQSVAEKYNTPDVEMLPPGNTLWRLSNALSWVAQDIEDVERKVEMMKIAGDVLPKVA